MLAHNICIAAQGVPMTNLLPWKSMYDTLWDHHLWILNWPLKCLIPTEAWDPITKSKGIADLHGHEQVELAIVLSIIGATKSPLTIHKVMGSEQKGKSIIQASTYACMLIILSSNQKGQEGNPKHPPLNPTSTNPHIHHVYFKGKRSTSKFVWEGEDDTDGDKEMVSEGVKEEDGNEQESPLPTC